MLVHKIRSDKVGVGGAGRVVLLASYAKIVPVASQDGLDRSGARGALFAGCAAEQSAFYDPTYLTVMKGRVRSETHRFNNVEMHAQRVRDVRFGGRQGCDNVNRVFERAAQSTAFDRNAQRAEARATEGVERRERKFTANLP